VAQKRRKFSPQFKAEAVQFVLETCPPIAEMARELEIIEGALGNWVNEWKRENLEPDRALTPVERARVAELEDEIRRLRLENELLKRVALDSTGHRNCAARVAAGVA
jgi:transposase-like protein